jgi:cytochrome c
MIKKMVLAISLVLSFMAQAEDVGTQDEAKALAQKAAKFYEEKGEEALKAFGDKAGEFVKKDLYVFIITEKGEVKFHGNNAALNGKNMWNIKDPDGKLFIQEMWKAASKDGAWVDYKFTHPVTKKIEPKASYVIKVKGKGLDKEEIVSVGAYKK